MNIVIDNEFEGWMKSKVVEICSDRFPIGAYTFSMSPATRQFSAHADRDDGTMEAVFSVSVDPTYLRAHINYYSPAITMWKAGELDRLERYLQHEITHIILEPIARLAFARYTTEQEITDTTEHAVELLNNIIWKLHKRTTSELGARQGGPGRSKKKTKSKR